MSARELGAQLGLHRVGREWRGACPACGYVGAFALTDGKYSPIGWCANGCDQPDIARALGDPRKVVSPVPKGKDARSIQDRLERAERIWRGSKTVLGSPAGHYLGVRGIGHLIACADLRFRTDCPHPSSTPERTVRLPALVAAVRDVDGRFVGVHRTFLRRDGSGKAEIEPRKASLGPVWGGAVRLTPLEQVIAANELVIGEGIETSASAGPLIGLPAWAALTAGNLASGVVLPSSIRKVVIAADRDAPDPARPTCGPGCGTGCVVPVSPRGPIGTHRHAGPGARRLQQHPARRRSASMSDAEKHGAWSVPMRSSCPAVASRST
jgi:putative DNA primase/helicase